MYICEALQNNALIYRRNISPDQRAGQRRRRTSLLECAFHLGFSLGANYQLTLSIALPIKREGPSSCPAWSTRSGNAFANPMATDAAIDRGVHRTIILEFDVPSYHTDAAQQRGQEQKVNPRVRSIGIRPPPIPPEARGPSRTAGLAPPCGGIHPPDGVLPP